MPETAQPSFDLLTPSTRKSRKINDTNSKPFATETTIILVAAYGGPADTLMRDLKVALAQTECPSAADVYFLQSANKIFLVYSELVCFSAYALLDIARRDIEGATSATHHSTTRNLSPPVTGYIASIARYFIEGETLRQRSSLQLNKGK